MTGLLVVIGCGGLAVFALGWVTRGAAERWSRGETRDVPLSETLRALGRAINGPAPRAKRRRDWRASWNGWRL